MLRTIALLAALTVATPVLAQKGPGGPCGECGPPTKAAIPEKVEYYGSFEFPREDGQFISGTIGNRNAQGQFVAQPNWGYSATPNDRYTFGTILQQLGNSKNGLKNGVTFASGAPHIGPASLLASAVKTLPNNASVTMNLFYTVKLSAKDLASADALAAKLAAGDPLGVIKGAWQTSISGKASAIIFAKTLGLNAGETFRRDCTNIPTAVDLSGCGSGKYELKLAFDRGDAFEGGSALDFYSRINLYATGGTYFDASPASALAYIDPTISFSQSLKGIDFTVESAGAPVALAFVPEPASWALMIGGFGLIGGYARRRRSPSFA